MKEHKKGNPTVVWLSVVVVIVGIVGLAIGRTFFPESEAFKWVWRLVWFVGVPILLLASYRAAVHGRRQSPDDTDEH